MIQYVFVRALAQTTCQTVLCDNTEHRFDYIVWICNIIGSWRSMYMEHFGMFTHIPRYSSRGGWHGLTPTILSEKMWVHLWRIPIGQMFLFWIWGMWMLIKCFDNTDTRHKTLNSTLVYSRYIVAEHLHIAFVCSHPPRGMLYATKLSFTSAPNQCNAVVFAHRLNSDLVDIRNTTSENRWTVSRFLNRSDVAST